MNSKSSEENKLSMPDLEGVAGGATPQKDGTTNAYICPCGGTLELRDSARGDQVYICGNCSSLWTICNGYGWLKVK